MRATRLLIVLVMVSAGLPALESAAQETTASLGGKVTDSTGLPLPGASLILKNQETGLLRTAFSSSAGRYLAPGLKPGVYEVTARLSGFVGQTRRDVVLELGSAADLDFRLAPEALSRSEAVEVVAKQPLVETTESQPAVVVNEAEIEGLPLNSRNVVELALLSPGVSAFRANAGPAFSPVNIGARNSRSTRVFVDGMDVSSDMLGGILPPGTGVAQNAVEQFQVVMGRFGAEQGQTDAGIIDLVTKSGTNGLRGSLFAFFRDDSLNARNHFDTAKPPYERQQGGLSIGGPLVRDRTHFFLAFEGNRENAYAVVFTNGAFPDLEGTFQTPARSSNFFARLDHEAGAAQSLTARIALATNSSEPLFGGAVARSAGVHASGRLDTYGLSHRWVASERVLTEASLGYVASDFTVDPLSADPHVIYPSVEAGRWPGGHQQLDERRWQFRGDVSYLVPRLRGEHHFRAGLNICRVRQHEAFDSLGTGLFLFGDDHAPQPFLGIIGDGNPDYGSVLNTRFGVYAQDEWRPVEKLTVNVGVRYDVETNATNQDYLSTKTDPSLPYVVRADRPADTNNLAPRLGVALDPVGDGKTVLRGGYGLFYGRVETDLPYGEIRSDQYRTYTVFAPGTTNKADINLAGRPYTLEWLLPRTVHTPYASQFSVGAGRQLTADVALDVSYVGSRGRGQIFARNDVNPLSPATFTRPLPQYEAVYVARTDGASSYDGLHVVLRKRFGGKTQFRLSYTLSKAENDFDDWHFAGHAFGKGPAAWDERHRLVFDGQVRLPGELQVSWIVSFASGRPYTIYTGDDANLNGDLTDDLPPGVRRNSERAQGTSNVDLRLGRVFKLGTVGLDVILEVFNLFNHVNYDSTSIVGNQSSPNFGQPTVALAPRQIQLGAKLDF